MTAYNNGQIAMSYEGVSGPRAVTDPRRILDRSVIQQLNLYERLSPGGEDLFRRCCGCVATRVQQPLRRLRPFVDYGHAGALIWFAAAGLLLGWIYRCFCNGSLWAVLVYPPMVTGLLELPRHLYWTQGGWLPALAALLAVAWYASRPDPTPCRRHPSRTRSSARYPKERRDRHTPALVVDGVSRSSRRRPGRDGPLHRGTGACLVARPDVELSVLCAAEAVDYWAAEVGDDAAGVSIGSRSGAGSGLVGRQGRGSEAFRQNFDVIQGTKHLLPRRTTATTVLTVHDLLPLDRPGDFGRLKRALLPGPYLASAAEADVLVCISAATRDRLLSYVPQVADRTSVIPLANESAGLGAAEPRAIAELRNKPFALVVGDSSPRKNLP